MDDQIGAHRPHDPEQRREYDTYYGGCVGWGLVLIAIALVALLATA